MISSRSASLLLATGATVSARQARPLNSAARACRKAARSTGTADPIVWIFVDGREELLSVWQNVCSDSERNKNELSCVISKEPDVSVDQP